MKIFYWIAGLCLVCWILGGGYTGFLVGAACFAVMGWVYNR